MIKPVPGARIVPRPVATTSEEAATDAFYQSWKRTDAQQLIENRKALSQVKPSPGTPQQPASNDAPPRSQDGLALGAAEAREALAANGSTSSIADRMRERHGLPTPRQQQIDFDRGAAAAREANTAAGGTLSLADRMRERHGLPTPRQQQIDFDRGAAAAREANTAAGGTLSLADRMRERHGIPATEQERGAAEASALLKIAGR